MQAIKHNNAVNTAFVVTCFNGYLLIAQCTSLSKIGAQSAYFESDPKAYVVHPSHQAFLNDIAGLILESFSSAQFVMTD